MSEKRCNQCKLKVGGRKSGRMHGEQTGHEWQPVVACLACHSAFKKQKLYKAHLPSCTGRPMAPNRSLPRNTPIIEVPPPANVSGDAVDSGSRGVLLAALINGGGTSLTKFPLLHFDSFMLFPTPTMANGIHLTACCGNALADAQPSELPAAVSLQAAVVNSTLQEELRLEPVQDFRQSAVNISSGSEAPTSDAAALPPTTPTEAISCISGPGSQEQQRNGLADVLPTAAAPCTLLEDTGGEAHFETMGTEGETSEHVKTLTPRWHCRYCFAEPCDEPVATICGHIFCRDCIVNEIATGMSCPACKKIFLVKLDVQV